MWSPTHIQVTVQRARGLLIKGKQGTNNCFVIIALGKEKFQTSVQEKAPESVTWNEECELQIPSQGNQAQLVLTALHHNSVGMDEFLGRVVLPLNEMEIYERPRSRWYKLESKDKDRERKKEKERGELEVRISFTVKAGSLTDLSKKTPSKSSISNLASSVGGSLLSIGAIEKRKGLRKLAKSLGSKMHISGLGRKGHKDRDEGPLDEEVTGGGGGGGGGGARTGTTSLHDRSTKQTIGDADPGVISEDEDEFVLDNLSHKSSTGSVSHWPNTQPVSTGSATGFRRHPEEVVAFHAATPVADGTAAFHISKASSSSSLVGAAGEIGEPGGSKQQRHHADSPAGKEKMDEWEQKLYGKHLEIGSTDSLKRRSWESSRVMLSAGRQEEQQQQEAVAEQVTLAAPEPQARSVPTSPELDGMAGRGAPKPVPRAGSRQDVSRPGAGTGEPVPEVHTVHSKPEKESFTKKIKHLIKDHGHHQRADSLENLTAVVVVPQRKLNGSKQASPFGHEQRIIIGGETVGTELGQRAAVAKAAAAAAAASMPLTPQTLAKYEGKSHEEMVRVAQGLENEVLFQKQKVKELEDYLDSLLLKVMECHPKILQNPYTKANPSKR
ncbi:rab11 family-interacting protein 1 isoform X2 [Anopheles aquasalis]|uniref:rab11 family-interacting protein 1 isoform X2 n=1 Tax=Anopheles aquasalis TaxID=42839 RepID=UPI00215A82D8|nr:rab11 family-interacting protein 1 isoform X2 [Anopheles aquasalis]